MRHSQAIAKATAKLAGASTTDAPQPISVPKKIMENADNHALPTLLKSAKPHAT
nr:MAG TPA: hypothetical protein [Caudoviricetes sp.]DAX41085.1 MAG TPA: hypothetical protein [Caudoviricetes sp.]